MAHWIHMVSWLDNKVSKGRRSKYPLIVAGGAGMPCEGPCYGQRIAGGNRGMLRERLGNWGYHDGLNVAAVGPAQTHVGHVGLVVYGAVTPIRGSHVPRGTSGNGWPGTCGAGGQPAEGILGNSHGHLLAAYRI